MATVRMSIEKSKGYAGIKGRKSYVARIEGTSEQFHFDRMFLNADEANWGDSKMYKRNRGTWMEYYDLPSGLYEFCRYGEIEFRIVWWSENDAKMKWMAVDADRAKALAVALDSIDVTGNPDQAFNDIRRATKPQKA